MPKAAAAAMKHHHHLVRDGNPKTACQFRVLDVFAAGHLDLQVVIAGAERADLIEAAVDGFVADLC
jgi:hypothetical protein